MEAKLIERIALNDEFQAACQRYAHGNGSSMAIAGAALRAAGMPELLQAAVLVRDYLHRNGTRQGDVPLALVEAIRATGTA
ncbi:hypothetical protein [Bordetella bronchiseptica]|uniref:hypothetical protein n=1 Tax=Bordetella bronchiseptica TaxID=518 RepID=UPI000E11D6BD|nr:hypothetical protein [Bordetella bronchiseptica]SUW10781.1 Uncharacterised protein [Bordetella bronchiseptica]